MSDTTPAGRTWRDLVVEIAHTWGVHGPFSDEEVDWLLWEKTPFPMGSEADVVEALNKRFAVLAGFPVEGWCPTCVDPFPYCDCPVSAPQEDEPR